MAAFYACVVSAATGTNGTSRRADYSPVRADEKLENKRDAKIEIERHPIRARA
jgi:hypothetical protein